MTITDVPRHRPVSLGGRTAWVGSHRLDRRLWSYREWFTSCFAATSGRPSRQVAGVGSRRGCSSGPWGRAPSLCGAHPGAQTCWVLGVRVACSSQVLSKCFPIPPRQLSTVLLGHAPGLVGPLCSSCASLTRQCADRAPRCLAGGMAACDGA